MRHPIRSHLFSLRTHSRTQFFQAHLDNHLLEPLRRLPSFEERENTAIVAYRQDSRKSLLDADPQYDGGYRHREGFAPPVVGTRQRGFRMYIPTTMWTWAFMLTACAQAMIILALES